MPTYTDNITATADSDPLIRELVGALYDLGGLDVLGPARLASIVTATVGYPGPLGDFRCQAMAAWEIARPPTDAELVAAETWDAGLIDWLGPDEIEDLADLDDASEDCGLYADAPAATRARYVGPDLDDDDQGVAA